MGIWRENNLDSLAKREERKAEFVPVEAQTIEEEREFPPVPRTRETTTVKRAAKKAVKNSKK